MVSRLYCSEGKLTPLLLIPLFAALNRAAGWNPIDDYRKKRGFQNIGTVWYVAPAWMRVANYATDKFACAAYAGLIVACWDWKLGLVTALGFAVWRLFGWGPMFHAFNGRPYVGTGFLSKAVGKIVSGELAAVIYGGLRGFLGLLLWAAGLALLDRSIAAVAILTSGACMGAVYWLGGIHQRATGKDTGIKISEVLFGALLGACMAGVVW